jgi:dipeptidase E
MKLYLSSYRIPTPDDLFELLPKPPEETRTAIIINAKDDPRRTDREERLHAFATDIANVGLHGTFVDLLEYTDKPVELAKELSRYDMLFACGGNTFLLRQAMRLSQFDRMTKKLLHDLDIVYAGESAGAIVAGTSLKGIEEMDELEALEGGEPIWEGLSLVNKQIIPHADNPDPRYAQRAREIASRISNPEHVQLLNDTQALVIDGESTSLSEV